VFAGYTVEGQIGAGATGVVWLATQVGIDRKVAIKQLAPALVSDETFRAQFRTEARLLASLSHPNVVTVFDYVEAGENAPYIVEEWVDGAALDRVVTMTGGLVVEQAVGVLRGALTGLVAAHAAGVVHGDVSATNILVDVEGTSKLVDFGLASSPGERPSSATPAYASPEAVQGSPLDARSDVYSAGCVLFELLAGTQPYHADSADALAAQHVSAPVPALPGGNRRVAEVVARAMAKEPAARYPDAATFLAALEESAQRDLGAAWLARASLAGAVLATTAAAGGATGGGAPSSIAATSATGRSSNVAKFASRRRVPLGIGGAAVVVAVVAVVALAGGAGGKKPAAPSSAIDPAKAAALAKQRGQSGSSPAAGNPQVDLTASGGVSFHIRGTKGDCTPDGFNLSGSDYPEIGSVLSVGRVFDQPSIKWIYKNDVGYLTGRSLAGIAMTTNPVKVVLNGATVRSGNAADVQLTGTITCPR
jgi:serine/threonine-protein kinase